MSTLDISIFTISIFGIFFEMWQKPVFWLTYIVAALLLGYEFLTNRLYGSAILQLIYVVLSVYGWYRWVRQDAWHYREAVCHTTLIQCGLYTIATICLSIICYFILKYSGDTQYQAEAILTAISIIATYMATLKQIESWFVFATTVIISVPLYYSYHLYFTCLAYLVFGILDFCGGIKWLLDYRKMKYYHA